VTGTLAGGPKSNAADSLGPGDIHNRHELGVLCQNNESPLTTDADRSSFFIALVVIDVLVGLADAISGPYTVLFLVDEVHLGPFLLSAILTARAVSGIAFGVALGAWFDKKPSVTPLLLALTGSTLGYTLLATTTNFAALLIIAAIPIAISAAAFSQSIALVKRHFDHAGVYTANRAIGVLRASWSLAWAIGPAAGAVIAGAFGFRGAFLASGASGAVALATLALVRARPIFSDSADRNRPKPAIRGLPIGLAFAALALFHTALFMGSIPLPIVLTTSLGGAESDVGLTFSLCAALEIVVMGALIWRPLRRGEHTAIVVGFVAFVAYYVALTLARSVGPVFWAQILRAIAIALVTYLGIGFLQSLLPHRAGTAAALFSSAAQVGSVVASLGIGVLAHAFGYASIFVACAILSAAGLAIVCFVRAEPD
jgi:MFS transporter, SET family, sugar efflux transporter